MLLCQAESRVRGGNFAALPALERTCSRGTLIALAGLLAFAAAAGVPAPADAAEAPLVAARVARTGGWRPRSASAAPTRRWWPSSAATARRCSRPRSASAPPRAACRWASRWSDADRATLFEKYRTRAGKRRVHRHLANRLVLQLRAGRLGAADRAARERRRLRLPHDARGPGAHARDRRVRRVHGSARHAVVAAELPPRVREPVHAGPAARRAARRRSASPRCSRPAPPGRC